MGIDHGVANLERHVTGTPSVAIHANTGTGRSEWRFRRSGHISGLDNSNRNVLRGVTEDGYSQVGGAARVSGNMPVTYREGGVREVERPDLRRSA
ncbi:hypothetical protein EST54_08215 [Streptomyces sioyaensis]|uniref:Uncharacterized protein n=1 Tax=Streptomyces sioyaensis TaxID=67364 RepID=A0A4V1NQK5_9ACTN|nr:hypothetical protein EST54_08215 [Streptomyces sioyaensis]